jgi:ankyrin repeat protein
LLAEGADPNIADKLGGTALMLATQHGSIPLIKLLLKFGADVHAADKAGNTVIMHADWRETGDSLKVRELLTEAIVNGSVPIAKSVAVAERS